MRAALLLKTLGREGGTSLLEGVFRGDILLSVDLLPGVEGLSVLLLLAREFASP